LQTPKRTKVATSVSELSEKEKKLLELVDGGMAWVKVYETWQVLYPDEALIVEGTLRYRYKALKSNLTGVADEDRALLPKLKQEIEEKFEKQKWGFIAEALEKRGGGKYPVSGSDSHPYLNTT